MDFFFFNDTATTEIYPLSLHDALPIYGGVQPHLDPEAPEPLHRDFVEVSVEPAHEPVCRLQKHDPGLDDGAPEDRKSTRLNSSHANISYAVFCLKKKKKIKNIIVISHT